ncbi:unnamed protein product [Blepharisma stoltei]|uniref:Cyclic nucleotide-binding domain-containing protein n=1 Tax=Blepharisma stoltei TaxID=1481888 RepID=A0AAU9IXN1_9CILI|nr:unnamed protein product [Blepharisma stoltei]
MALSARAIEDFKQTLMSEPRSRAQMNKLRFYVKSIDILKPLPLIQKIQMCKCMELFEHKKGSQIISIKDKVWDFFMVLTGKVAISSPGLSQLIIEPMNIFGKTNPLAEEIHGRINAVAEENSFIIKIPIEKYMKIMSEFISFLEKKKSIEFIEKSIPGGKLISESGKQRILNLFTDAEFKSGEIILKEGEIPGYCFIIREGECKQVNLSGSKKHPWGFMSRTMSCFNYDLAVAGEWVGESSLLFNKPLEFSVIASTYVKAMKITSHALIHGFPKMTISLLKESVGNKVDWWTHRRESIMSTVNNGPLNEGKKDIDETFMNTERGYPKASKAAISSLRRLDLAKTDYRPELMNSRPKIRNLTPVLYRKNEEINEGWRVWSPPKARSFKYIEKPKPEKKAKTILCSGAAVSSNLLPTYTPPKSRKGSLIDKERSNSISIENRTHSPYFPIRVKKIPSFFLKKIDMKND